MLVRDERMENVRFGRFVLPNPDAMVSSKATAIAMNTILARVTKDNPNSLSVEAIAFAGPAKSSGESSWVKASLKVREVVAIMVARAAAKI